VTNQDGEDRIQRLLAELDQHQEGRDENAQAELLRIGPSVIPALIDRAASLSSGGQLCAIEVFRSLNAPESEPMLILLLSSENATVRIWAAEALGHLGMTHAAPELRALLARSRKAGTAPDDREPVSARHALTSLGARTQIVPAGLHKIMARDSSLGLVTEDRHLTVALECLSAGDQVVAYFQRWTPWQETWTWVDGASFELDWAAPWPKLVEQSRNEARAAVASRTPNASAVVTIEWLGIEDWPPT